MHSGSEASCRGSSRCPRLHFSAEQKVALVKRHLVDGVPVSNLRDEHGILPTQFYQWQKQLFEQGALCRAISCSVANTKRVCSNFWCLYQSSRDGIAKINPKRQLNHLVGFVLLERRQTFS